MSAEQWIAIGVAVAVALLIVALAHWLLYRQVSRVWPHARFIVERSSVTAYFAAAVIGANMAMPEITEVGWSTYQTIQHAMRILMIASLTGLGVSLSHAATDMILDRLSASNGDADRRARRLQTQLRLLRRVITSIIVILAIAAILFTFDEVRALGAGLLASAGIIGIVAGVAAQATLANLFAGLQLAFSDALRIGDVVVVKGEWGRIEELSLVNVTVKIWDERRLVVPVANFTTMAFENWTKSGTDLTTQVRLPLDWEVPVEQVREEAGRFITANEHWDGRNWSCQVVDITPTGEVVVRVVATVADSGAHWNLAVQIREHLVTWLAEHHPLSLPRHRTEFISESGEAPYASTFPESAFRRPVREPSGAGTQRGGISDGSEN
ncbi:mechanosensitive ion channel family protein [Nocardiopsis sp. CNT312]|uniref:mechanosensitive ion channel family protein n=1 Tax=Nocardiopsis sp. CNT312 TaxID=1137268 RepID=UPI0004B7FB80|nr:mechanosensitive ion channel domain-containing protein [Nocardiopsis sp. CNT312]